MKTVSLDVQAEASQLVVVSADGEVLLEMKVPTTVEDLRRVVGAICGPKRVVFEAGPLSAMLYDALSPLAEKVVSCDPARNALIGRAEDSNDERDARRGLLGHEGCLCADMTAVKNRIKALAKRHDVACRGASASRHGGGGDGGPRRHGHAPGRHAPLPRRICRSSHLP